MTTIGMMYKFSKVYLAMIMGVKVYCFSVGSNTKPYNKLTEILVKVLLNNVDGISTRDKKSYIFLNKLCPNLKISPNADPALLLKSTEKTLLNDKKGRVTIGINVMPYYKLLNGDISKLELIRKNIAATIDLSINKLNAHFVFIPMVEGDDTNEQDEIIRYIEQVDQITILKPKYSPKELMGIMRGLDVFIGTRLHPNILAFNVNTVILGIAYHDKINSFFSYLNHEDLVVSLFDFNPDALFNKLKYALANNKTIKNDFQVRQGELRKLAVNSFVALKNLK
jgi:polysaccharide pyruvyl transferase WcaK-like protein